MKALRTRPLKGVLSRMLLDDHRLPRPDLEPELYEHIPSLAQTLASHSPKLIYTAFDGDHLALTPQMRSYVLARAGVPVDPESTLGYKQLVEARVSKAGVITDDIALLQRCDELWVFSDAAPSPKESMSELAEGVIAELLYFLRRKGVDSGRRVMFVPISAILGQGSSARPYVHTYEETVAALGDDQAGILSLVDTIEAGRRSLPRVAYVVCDPLDMKYGHWLRAGIFKRGLTPLVPQLSIDLRDAMSSAPNGADYAVACWARLLDLADELWVLQATDYGRRDAYVVELLRQVWQLRTTAARPIEKPAWKDFDIPKVLDEQGWPLTEREGQRCGD